MIYLNDTRQSLEAAIIAEVITYQNAYTEIGHLLRPENFCCGFETNGEALHRSIWKCIERMYPEKQITLLTLTFELRKININAAYAVTEISNASCFAINRQQHCYMLLEMDLRRNFVALINTLIEGHKSNPVEWQDLQEISSYAANPATDVFEAIEQVHKYFTERPDYEAEKDEVKRFNERIDIRIKDIKRAGHIKSLMTNLDSIYNFPAKKKITITCLVDILKYCMVCGELPDGLDDELLKMRQKI